MIDVNCDMGEGIGNEKELMPFISSANIACGYHAGDATTIMEVINLCLQYNVNIGAHPSFLDRESFGRTAMQLSPQEIYTIVTDQLKIINTIAIECGAKLHHVKPHGALYNIAAKDIITATAIAKAVKDFDERLIYFGLSGSVMIAAAEKIGLKTANEVFADRTYQADGTLTPRTQPNALIKNNDIMIKHIMQMVKENRVTAITGEEIFLQADTICIHGDGENAVEFAKTIHKKINEV
ncbi:5-oxoprolinase subunit PxpA [Ferruginibacter sp.]